MEIVIYKNGETFGTAWVEEDGARLRFRAKCPFLPGIYRLYIWEENGDTLPLGVLLPEGGGLALERTVNRPRSAFSGLSFFRYGVLCEGDTQPEPLAAHNAAAEEKTPEQETQLYARLDRWLETTRPESFTEDEVLRRTLTGARGILYRYRTGCIELAVPVAGHAYIAPALLFARAEEIRGKAYFVLKLTPEGLPRQADAPSTY